MSGIDFSNVKIKGLEPINFYKNEKYRHIGISSSFSTLVPMYKELLREVINNKVDENFHDMPLSTEQTQQVKSIFEHQIDKTLLVHEPYQEGYQELHFPWKGETYVMMTLAHTPKNRRILDFHEIYLIAKECLSENKPMYLSIEQI